MAVRILSLVGRFFGSFWSSVRITISSNLNPYNSIKKFFMFLTSLMQPNDNYILFNKLTKKETVRGGEKVESGGRDGEGENYLSIETDY